MFEIDPAKTQQIVMTKKQSRKLKIELEEMFIAVDTDSPYGMYSMSNMEGKYPLLAELFVTLA